MKYLFITLDVQDGERKHTHRILHTTNAKNIEFAAQRYVANFWGYGERQNKEDDFWWFFGEITCRLYSVVELTEAEYKLMSDVFSGNVRIPTKEEIRAYLKEWGQKQGEITANLGYPASHSESDELLMEDYFFLEGKKQWYPKTSRMYSEREQTIANFVRDNQSHY
jgi:hypothetical protein